MAKDNEETAGLPPPENQTNGDLPTVDSPPLSPAGKSSDAPAAPEPALEPTDLVVVAPEAAPSARARFRFKARHKRNALLAASVAAAAALGVLAGVAASGGLAPTKSTTNTAERQAMQQSIGKLRKEIVALKASIAATDASAHSEIGKITERLRNAPEITGSIPVPPAAVPTPLPSPRPAVAEVRPPVVHDWSIRYVRDGYVYVRQGHGDTYQVQLGAPLPGLGPVEAVKRQGGRWLVVTPKGLIVSMRDRRYFERF